MTSEAEPSSTLSPALLQLLQWLRAQDYGFVTVSPATHARVLQRAPDARARTLRDAFGWSRAFTADLLPPPVLQSLQAAGLAQQEAGGLWRSAVRCSTLHGELFAHSAYPTTEQDAVFFGPDTYRFADLVLHELRQQALGAGARILDVGCGSGAGGIAAARVARGAHLVLSDINPRALQFASANATHAGIEEVRFVQGDLFAPVDGSFDLLLANPPYLNDAAERTYRHGGGRWGEALSLRIVREGLPRLAPGGRLVLYTGVAIADGVDPLLEGLQGELGGVQWSYRELDPDVFGEELEQPAYADAERIAAVALVCTRA